MRVALQPQTLNIADGRAQIDPLFVEVCAPRSLVVTSVVVDRISTATACVDATGALVVRARVDVGQPLPLTATVMVRGIRAGRENVRFRRFSAAQMAQNDLFWRRGYEN